MQSLVLHHPRRVKLPWGKLRTCTQMVGDLLSTPDCVRNQESIHSTGYKPLHGFFCKTQQTPAFFSQTDEEQNFWICLFYIETNKIILETRNKKAFISKKVKIENTDYIIRKISLKRPWFEPWSQLWKKEPNFHLFIQDGLKQEPIES